MLHHRGQIHGNFYKGKEAEGKIMCVDTKPCCSMKTNFTSLAQNNSINLPPISDIFSPTIAYHTPL